MESRTNKYYSVREKDLNSSNSYCAQRPDLVTPRKLTKMTGCLEIIVGEDFGRAKSSQDSQCNIYSSDTFNRPGSGSIECVLPRADSSLSRRVNTPTKQISLQAIPRKEDSAEPFADQVDWQSLGLKSNNQKIWELGVNEAGKEPQKEIYNLKSVDGTSQIATPLSLLKPSTTDTTNTSQRDILSDSYSTKVSQEIEINNQGDKNNSDDQDGNDSGDDDSDSSEEEEKEKLKAPNELLMEFVDCLMRKDFQTTSKLCKMILLYEPNNPEALKFQPLIEEKLALDAAAEKEEADEGVDGDGDDDDDDSSSSEEDDDDDGSEDSSDNDDSSSSDDENDDDGDQGSNAINDKNKKKTPIGLRPCHH